ncbi:hypothetical protein [Dyadobacter sp. CY323]|uniref:hypothetical protein n=1 Tax=Dyadobacter sp. CY323 TaxID=2907302 RepID=UPI001F47F71F|nr:hypothetical protein [Dyadobacter sp. CY323]MCE6991461.1 hypothetical protein [Dyadobacter sp. CY323]
MSVIIDEIGEQDVTYFLTTDISRKSPLRIKRDKVWKIIYANNDVELITPQTVTKAIEPKIKKAMEETYSDNNSKPNITENQAKRISGGISKPHGDSISFKSEKKKNRLFIAGSVTRQKTGNYYTGLGPYEYHPGFKVGYERFAFNKGRSPNQKKSNAGFGIEINNLFDYYAEYEDFTLENDYYKGSKHILSPYIFREFDIKRFFTFGIAGGPFGSVTWVSSASSNDINPSQSAAKVGGGLHSSEYIQKYLVQNRRGLRTLYVRMGFDQYLTTTSGFNGTFCLAIGF